MSTLGFMGHTVCHKDSSSAVFNTEATTDSAHTWAQLYCHTTLTAKTGGGLTWPVGSLLTPGSDDTSLSISLLSSGNPSPVLSFS